MNKNQMKDEHNKKIHLSHKFTMKSNHRKMLTYYYEIIQWNILLVIVSEKMNYGK